MKKTFYYIYILHNIHYYKKLSEYKRMATYYEKLDYYIIKQHGLDFIKVRSLQDDKETKTFLCCIHSDKSCYNCLR